jgi:hypothetical protein
MPSFTKLDKKIIALYKKICELPNCIPNVTAQLPQNLFSMEAFSLKNAYLRCIGKQLRNALNDKGHLGYIYIGLINYVLAKHNGTLIFLEVPFMIAEILFSSKLYTFLKPKQKYILKVNHPNFF